jgi:hypothetical protein
MEKLYLIYINNIGKDWKGNYLYEFLYSDNLEGVDGDDWDSVPASGRPEPPHEEFVKKVGRLTTEIKLSLIQDSDTFCIWDAVDGIIALGWENIDEYGEYPETRLWFKYGEDLSSINDKLYEKDIVLDYEKNK